MAAEWLVQPSLSVAETYSDNVSLLPDAEKLADWVTEVTPAIAVSGTGPRLKLKAFYAPQLVYYARGTEDNEIYQRGNASGNAELASELLFLDFGADVSQHPISLRAPVASSNVNASGNTATVGSYFASPYLRRTWSGEAEAEARYTGSAVRSDDQSSLSNSIGQRVDLKAKSGPARKLINWELNYAWESIEYEDDEGDVLSDVGLAQVGVLVQPSTRLIGQAGYEKYVEQGGLLTTQGEMWALGIEWTPSPRTRVQALAGHRFYGEAYHLEATYRARLAAVGIFYNERITTTRSELLATSGTTTAAYLDSVFASQYPDPIARAKAVEDFIARTGLPPNLNDAINFFNNELFLAKRWSASIGSLGVRNTVLANVFWESRAAILGDVVLPTDGDFAASDTVDQTGVGLQWNYRLSPVVALNAGWSYSRNEYPSTGQVDHVRYTGLSVSREFEKRLFGSLAYRRQDSKSPQPDLNYIENAVIATLRLQF